MKNTTDTLREQLRASYNLESAGFTCLGTCLFEVLLMGISLQENLVDSHGEFGGEMHELVPPVVCRCDRKCLP